jgi:hypothetical protein
MNLLFIKRVYLSLIIVLGAVILYGIAQMRIHKNLTNVYDAVAHKCEFVPPGELRNGPFEKSKPWCNDLGPLSLYALMDRMEIKCVGMDGCIAAEFGSYVRVAMISNETPELFIINPIQTNADDSLMECVDTDNNNEPVSKTRRKSITIDFLDRSLNKQTRTFVKQKACIIQMLIEEMH